MAVGIVVTNNGEEWLAERVAGVQGSGTNAVSGNNGTHIGWGTGTTTPVKADTGLQTASAEARVGTTVTVTGTGATAAYQATATITSASTQTINEAGLFSAVSAGICFVHSVFTGVAVVSGDSIAFTLTIDPA